MNKRKYASRAISLQKLERILNTTPPQKPGPPTERKPDLRLGALAQRFNLAQRGCLFIQQNPEIIPAIEQIQRHKRTNTRILGMRQQGKAFLIDLIHDEWGRTKEYLSLAYRKGQFTYCGDKENCAEAFQSLIGFLHAQEVQPPRTEIQHEGYRPSAKL